MGDPSTVRLPRDVPLGSPSRPTWRGRIHLIGLCVALPLLVVLAILADGGRARAGVIVYAVGLCSMLTVSTTYHRWVHTIRARHAWRRLDHATIFAAIAGTFTAVTLIAVPTGWAIALLILIWAAAVTGAAVKIAAFASADRIGVVMYITTGWAGLLLIPALWDHGVLPLALLFAGGVLYTVGAVGFGRQWPTLRPSTFSYHEVWHAMTIAAAGAHMAAVWSMATS
jgi:hemolysin III